MKKNSFTMIDQDGKEIIYDVLFTFESDETKINYIAYTDNQLDGEGNLRVYASTYTGDIDHMTLEAIETEKEWKIIDKILEEIQNKFKQNDDNGE